MDDLERLAALVPALVRVVKALRDFGDDVRRHVRRNARLLGERCTLETPEVRPLDVLHAEEQPFVAP